MRFERLFKKKHKPDIIILGSEILRKDGLKSITKEGEKHWELKRQKQEEVEKEVEKCPYCGDEGIENIFSHPRFPRQFTCGSCSAEWSVDRNEQMNEAKRRFAEAVKELEEKEKDND